jgi:hypothetical protein
MGKEKHLPSIDKIPFEAVSVPTAPGGTYCIMNSLLNLTIHRDS